MVIVQSTDKVCDRLNEINGLKVPTDKMYQRILLQLGIEAAAINSELLMAIKSTVRTLFLSRPPHFLNPTVLPLLQHLKDEGYGISIGSNTGFIEGGTIIDILRNLNIFEYFDFCIFSDEVGASKPSAGFYEKVYEQIDAKKEEVIHIGDNYKADYEGALNYGFKALHINNQSYTINDIKRHLQAND